MGSYKWNAARLSLLAVVAIGCSCNRGADPEVVAASQKERVDNAERALSVKAVEQGAGFRIDDQPHTLSGIVGPSSAKARCDSREVEATYDPYRRSLELTLTRNEADALDEMWTTVRLGGKVREKQDATEQLGFRFDDGSAKGSSFTWKIDGKTEDRDALISTGGQVSLDLEFKTVVSRKVGDEQFKRKPASFKGIKVEFYGYSEAESKALRTHRKERQLVEAVALEYDEREEGSTVEEMRELGTPEANAVLADFSKRRDAAHEALDSAPDAPVPEGAEGVKVTMECESS